MHSDKKPVIAIALGDVAGISPEIVMKALSEKKVYDLCNPIVVGSAKVMRYYAESMNIPVVIRAVEDPSQAKSDKGIVNIIDVDNLALEDFRVGAVQASTGKAMLEYTDKAVQLALEGKADALIGAPTTKKSVELAGTPFNGYPDYVAQLTNTKLEDTFLMLCAGNFRVVNTTLHVSLREAIDMLDQQLVLKAIRAGHRAALGLSIERPRIAVAGLNPHAGEDGMFGTEEIDIIVPAMEQARSEGIDVSGPVGADALFADFGGEHFDMYIAMVHDQAHIAAKIKGSKGVSAVTIGTPVLFSSVGHGTALDIAGKGIADPTALIHTIEMLSRVSVSR